MSTKDELKELAFAMGAEIFGIASAADYERYFPDKPKPSNFLENATSLIVIGMPFEPPGIRRLPVLAGVRG